MHFSLVKDTVLEVWKNFLHQENFKLIPHKTRKYSCHFENKKVELRIYVERYFQKFNIEFIRKGDHYGRDVFSLLEFFQGENSRIYPMLFPMSSTYNFNQEFAKRFFLKNHFKDIEDFKKIFFFFSEVIQAELPQLLEGNFSFLPDYRLHHTKSRSLRSSATAEEKLLLEKDFQVTYYQYGTYPEQNIIDEISSQIKQGRRIDEYSKYELTPDEKEWIYNLKYDYQSGYLRLSMEYLEAFEKLHNITLPRAYKLFFNWVGNGKYKLFKLEHATTYFEKPLDGCGHYKFINLEKPFSPNQGSLNFNGAIKLHDFGCGIHHYLVVNGRHYGQVWIDDHGNSGEIYPMKNKKGKHIGFREWYEQLERY